MGSETGPSCPEHFTTFNTYDPLDPNSEIDDSSSTVISCLTTCLGPPPEGSNEVKTFDFFWKNLIFPFLKKYFLIF